MVETKSFKIFQKSQKHEKHEKHEKHRNQNNKCKIAVKCIQIPNSEKKYLVIKNSEF